MWCRVCAKADVPFFANASLTHTHLSFSPNLTHVFVVLSSSHISLDFLSTKNNRMMTRLTMQLSQQQQQPRRAGTAAGAPRQQQRVARRVVQQQQQQRLVLVLTARPTSQQQQQRRVVMTAAAVRRRSLRRERCRQHHSLPSRYEAVKLLDLLGVLGLLLRGRG